MPNETRAPFLMIAWVLYMHTGRVLLDPPRAEHPQVVKVYQDDDALINCKLAAEALIDKLQVIAWCVEAQ